MGSKYQQVSDWLRSQITNGVLKTNDKVDSENDLVAHFGVSRQTVRHAIDQLVQEGLLFKIKGSGTYVKDTKAVPESVPDQPVSRTVGIVSTYVDGYIFPKILQAMVKQLGIAGYDARLSFTENDLKKERELLESYLARGCTDPLVVEPVMSGLPNPNVKYYREIQKKGIPVVFFHSYYPEIQIPHISMNDVQAGRMATDYLLSMGHQRIIGIFKNEDGQGTRRYRGFLSAMMSHGIEVKPDNIIWVDSLEMRDSEKMSYKLSARLNDCTGIVCYNDEVAFEVTKYAFSKGIRIPDDLSIVSIDNSELAVLNPVSLTSVRHPMEKLGERTVNGILELIQNPEKEITYEFDTDLVIRDSVKQIK